jgi:hypothetical protein
MWFSQFLATKLRLGRQIGTYRGSAGTGYAPSGVQVLGREGGPRGRRPMDVESTAISEIDYGASRTKLLVRFQSGERYIYVGVPGEVHRAFVESDSKGRFFQLRIRDCYPFNRLEA